MVYIYIYDNGMYIYTFMTMVFANGMDVQSQVDSFQEKMVFYAAMPNNQPYGVMIKSKVEHSREKSSSLPYTSVL